MTNSGAKEESSTVLIFFHCEGKGNVIKLYLKGFTEQETRLHYHYYYYYCF